MEESDSDSDSEKAWSYDATQVTKLYMFRAKQGFCPFVGRQAKKKQQVESESEESEAVEVQCAATVTHESE